MNTAEEIINVRTAFVLSDGTLVVDKRDQHQYMHLRTPALDDAIYKLMNRFCTETKQGYVTLLVVLEYPGEIRVYRDVLPQHLPPSMEWFLHYPFAREYFD